MDDIEEYVDANEVDNYMAKSFKFSSFCKEYWLAIATAVTAALALVQSSIFKLNLEGGAAVLMLPADMFLRHVRGFMVLFVIFSAASRASLFAESKGNPVKRKVILSYFVSGLLTLLVGFLFGYLLIPAKGDDLPSQYFVKFLDPKYTPGINFVKFLRGLAVHDIPGNVLTTRFDVYNQFGRDQVKDGLGDGYNGPGFIVFGLLIAASTYFLGKDGEIVRNIVHLVHKCLLGVYWMLLCYSPIAIYFSGIVTFDTLSKDGTFGYLCLRYLLLFFIGLLVALVRIFIVLPLLHFVRCGSFGFDVILKVAGLLPTAFMGGSSVRMVEKTKYYLKSKRFNSEIVDSYLPFCTVANGECVGAGFALTAIFALKLFGNDIDWSVFLKIVITGLLYEFAITEYIQCHLFAVIFFLNTSMITADFIVPIILADWLYDRLGIVANTISDALTIDYIESIHTSGRTSVQNV
ncbi:hypothetical protein BEWA_009820 [Theileria equi strain WA]|uniref:Amino acid transporter n=1 Tax=Theileria equi strain WA TaxID=1537102 RepID=L0B244_THEEQ|nr:hypothetical protein BEWA_009820 [Theileria equi strain WA]AFZ81568.1 hypothetical protein BEWA_009820 [Theileria equi strain WA]|eukprot:XP_004831234.1 hypothetical protein BEWA_009820 [Theileria equi strain WA]